MTDLIFSDTRCALGEGPLWHPQRRSLFWCDILERRLYESTGAQQRMWQFDEHVSASGWIDRDTLLVASESSLFKLNLEDGSTSLVHPLEDDKPHTRSNDGRADPKGGFWIGTMAKEHERPEAKGQGSIYRFYRGELRRLFPDITISNAICFAPDGTRAYFTDTTEQRVRTVTLDAQGWPNAAAETFVDLSSQNLNPDGAVVDAEGNMWMALWGSSRVDCFAPDGRYLRSVGVPAEQVTCPSFGGPDFATLYVTSAAHGASEQDTWAGATFATAAQGQGRPEAQVLL